MIKKRYYTDIESGTTVCVSSDYDNANQEIEKKHITKDYIYNAPTEMYWGKKPIVGVAKCHQSDQFDENTGKNLASARVDLQYHRQMAEEYAIKIKKLQQTINTLERLENSHQRKAEKIKEIINQQIDEVRMYEVVLFDIESEKMNCIFFDNEADYRKRIKKKQSNILTEAIKINKNQFSKIADSGEKGVVYQLVRYCFYEVKPHGTMIYHKEFSTEEEAKKEMDSQITAQKKIYDKFKHYYGVIRRSDGLEAQMTYNTLGERAVVCWRIFVLDVD